MSQATRLGEARPGGRNSTGKGPQVGEWLVGSLGSRLHGEGVTPAVCCVPRSQHQKSGSALIP